MEIRDFSAEEIIRINGTGDFIVSPLLFGSNLEHTRSDVFNGISAQMLRNRKFAGKPAAYTGCPPEWKSISPKAFIHEDKPFAHHAEGYHMKRIGETVSIDILNFTAGEIAGVKQQELSVEKDKAYEFRLVAKVSTPLEITVELRDRTENAFYCRQTLRAANSDWETLSCTLVPCASDADASLRISFSSIGHLVLGAVSLLPQDNFRGMRKDVIAALKEVGIGLLRWPGGNFAGEYAWQDGLLPVDERAPFESYMHLETQPHSLGYDFHELSTDDFIALCREIGAEPFITINSTWNTPEENAHWVEYCNGDASTAFGSLRARNGHPAPYNVKYWSLGNEMGYGHMEGDNSAEGYARNALAQAKAMLKADPTLLLCQSGPYPNAEWSEKAAKPLSSAAPFVSLHHYDSEMRYADLDAIREEYEARIVHVETVVRPKLHRMCKELSGAAQISFDEYNIWYAWYRQSCIYDGLFMALMQHMLLSEAQTCGIGLACRFESVNEGDMHVFPDHTVLSATGQAFAAMKHHIGGTLMYSSPFAAVTEKDGVLTGTFVNAAYDKEKTFEIPDFGANAKAYLLRGEHLLPNTFFSEEELPLYGNSVTLPPLSLLLIKG